MIRFEVKHWRKIDIAIISSGAIAYISGFFVQPPHSTFISTFGFMWALIGWTCYMYDGAIERAGCAEKVAREMGV